MNRLLFHQRITIGLALGALRSAVTRSATATFIDLEVRVALWCLYPHCPERWPLDLF